MRLKHQHASQPAHPINVDNPLHSHLAHAPLSRRPTCTRNFALLFPTSLITSPLTAHTRLTCTLYFSTLILFFAFHAPTRPLPNARLVGRARPALHPRSRLRPAQLPPRPRFHCHPSYFLFFF